MHSTQRKPGLRVTKLNRDLCFAVIMKTVLYRVFIMSEWELKWSPNWLCPDCQNLPVSQR